MTSELKVDILKRLMTFKLSRTILSTKLAFDLQLKVLKQEVQAKDLNEQKQLWVEVDNECSQSLGKQSLIEKLLTNQILKMLHEMFQKC